MLSQIHMEDPRIRFSYRDGRTEDVDVTAGQVLAFPALSHLPENLGDEAFEAIAVELKSWCLSASVWHLRE